MICLITRNQELVRDLTALLKKADVAFRVVDPASDLALSGLYTAGIAAAVVDDHLPSMPTNAWFDLLGSLGRRIPVFVLGRQNVASHDPAIASRNSELMAWVDAQDAAQLMSMLDSVGATGKDGKQAAHQCVPVYNSQVPLHMLKGHGALSLLTINASSFRKVAIEYGVEAYQSLQDCFLNILYQMWGSPGCFRLNDMLMRRSNHSNTYYVFLEQSRISRTVPAPGVLEKMADRIAVRLQKELWDEMFKDKSKRTLPNCIELIPEFSIGYSTALYNPCVDSVEILEQVLENSVEVAKVQARRMKDRSRELVQTMIQAKDVLYPHYQAVFHLKGMTKEMVDQAKSTKSVAPLKNLIYGFESLIRIRHAAAEEKIAGDQLVHLESRYLRPDILFALAGQAKVALELDQLCLKLGIAAAVDLPGKLMVNVLPRNLQHLPRLTHLLTPRGNIIFELSESEGISNPQLMDRIRDYVSKIGCSIAADDFGKGHASIERVIKLRPEMIKLDRSLVENVHRDTAKRAFVEGVIKAAKSVQAVVLAEGVELWDEAAAVQSMGVDLIQGYLCHKPQAVEEVLAQLATADSEEELSDLDSVA